MLALQVTQMSEMGQARTSADVCGMSVFTPPKRTSRARLVMSQKGHNRKSGVAAAVPRLENGTRTALRGGLCKASGSCEDTNHACHSTTRPALGHLARSQA